MGREWIIYVQMHKYNFDNDSPDHDNDHDKRGATTVIVLFKFVVS